MIEGYGSPLAGAPMVSVIFPAVGDGVPTCVSIFGMIVMPGGTAVTARLHAPRIAAMDHMKHMMMRMEIFCRIFKIKIPQSSRKHFTSREECAVRLFNYTIDLSSSFPPGQSPSRSGRIVVPGSVYRCLTIPPAPLPPAIPGRLPVYGWYRQVHHQTATALRLD